jgi:hypothetical protein
MQQRRPRGVRLHSTATVAEARVRIASDERYPWALGGFAIERGPLPAGDYGLVDGERILAVVERKTFDGLLADFGKLDVLRQQVLELTAFEHHAVVIEARYEDFLSPGEGPPLVGRVLCQGHRRAVRRVSATPPGVLVEPEDRGGIDPHLRWRDVAEMRPGRCAAAGDAH